MRFADRVTAFLMAWAAAVSAACMARADDAAQLFHAQNPTTACADATATRSLNDPDEPRRTNAAWLKSTFADGRCVSVTPKSPWRFVSRDGDVAMMDYAGTIGPPGSYYFSVAALTDANGRHPGDAAPAGPSSAPGAAAASSETALAPGAQPADATPQAGSPAAAVGAPAAWGVTNTLLLVIALVLCAIGGFVVGRWGPREITGRAHRRPDH